MRVSVEINGDVHDVEQYLDYIGDLAQEEYEDITLSYSYEDLEAEQDETRLNETVQEARRENMENFESVDPETFDPNRTLQDTAEDLEFITTPHGGVLVADMQRYLNYDPAPRVTEVEIPGPQQEQNEGERDVDRWDIALAKVTSRLNLLNNLKFLKKNNEALRELRDAVGLLGSLYAFELQMRYPEESNTVINSLPIQQRVALRQLAVRNTIPALPVEEDAEREFYDDQA
jgi:hypothetical protein